MKLNIIKPKEPTALAKMTVHKTGKLGLSKGAMEMLDVETNKFIKFGYNEEEDFFMVMCIEPDEETFNVAKAGAYYYITAKTLLEDLQVDYKSEDTTIFDIVKTDERDIYKLIKRVINR